jgi:uncharacterized cupin superfamily protein
VRVFNVFGEDWETEVERPGGRFKDTPIGPRIGGERLGASLYELGPGERGWPYHWHHGNEELLIVLRGRPTLRAPDGERELESGDCVHFPRGPDGAHTVRNDRDEPARFLIFSTLIAPEMLTYPDSGKLGARSPFGRGLFLEDTNVDYWAGEV